MKKLISIVLAGVLCLAVFAGCTDKKGVPQDSGTQTPSTNIVLSGKVSTGGSTSTEKAIGGLIEAFAELNPDVTITYDPTGSSAGITAATEGTTDIGLSSRNLKDAETGLDATVFAIDGIAIIVNSENPISDLTIEQIKKLATGEIKNWNEIGGNDSEVVLIGREPGSGTRDGFESIIDVKDACVYQQELNATGAVIAAVKSNPNAIGYASLSAVENTVKTVKVNGVTPSKDTVLDGTYLVQRPFIMVTNQGKELSAQGKAFMEFAQSADAKQIIENAGVFAPAK